MVLDPFTPKESPFDEQNRLALDRVKSIKSLSGVKRLREIAFNPFTPKWSPFDGQNRLALDRVKSIKSLLGVKGLTINKKETLISFSKAVNIFVLSSVTDIAKLESADTVIVGSMISNIVGPGCKHCSTSFV